MKKLRVLILDRWPEFGGGSEAMSLAVAKELRRQNVFTILGYDQPGSLLKEYESQQIPMVQVPLVPFSCRKAWPFAKSVMRVVRLVHRYDINLVFSSNLRFFCTTALLPKVAPVFHLSLVRPDYRRISALAVRTAKAGIAPANHVIESWQRRGFPNHKLYLVANWTDPTRFEPPVDRLQVRRRLRLPDDRKLVGLIGRVVPEKGGEVLVRAAGIAKRLEPSLALIFVGRADEGYKLRLQMLGGQLGLSSTDMLFFNASSDVQLFLQAMDLAVVPSLCQEAFGLCLVEAMATGLVTLASDVGEFANILGSANSDLLHRPGDSGKLGSDLIRWLADTEEARSRGARLRDRVLSHYSPKNATAYVEIFRSVLNR